MISAKQALLRLGATRAQRSVLVCHFFSILEAPMGCKISSTRHSIPLHDGENRGESGQSRRQSSSSAHSSEFLSPRASSLTAPSSSTPPRAAVLRWPNGQTSTGQLIFSEHFQAFEADGPFAQRCRKADRSARSEIIPGPIEVVITSIGPDGDLAYVEPTLLETVQGIYPGHLEDLAETAGGDRGGLYKSDKMILSNVVQSALHRIKECCTDPLATQRALEALERPFTSLTLRPVGQTGSAAHNYSCEVECDEEDEQDLGETLFALEEGEHLLLRCQQVTGQDGHSLAVSVTRLSEDSVQVNLFNSNGWSEASGRNNEDRHPAIGKVVPIEDASAAFTSLSGGVIELPAVVRTSHGRDRWHSVSGGLPLAAWLRSVDPRTPLQPTGQRMTPQKGDDCAIEVEFAWLASVLSKADYKLAKAHTLNVLTEAAVEEDLDEIVLERLRERVTSSLSAHAMATGD